MKNLLFLMFLATPAVSDAAGNTGKPPWIERLFGWFSPELPKLGDEIEILNHQIASLPAPLATNSGSSAGFQTVSSQALGDKWVALTMRKAVVVDRVVLVPTLITAATGTVEGFGFPVRFILEAIDDEGESQVLMDQTTEDFPNPGLFPVSVQCPPLTKFRSFRLTATEPWSRNGTFVLSFAEIMLLRGNLNLASNSVVSSVSSREFISTWSRDYLTDMKTPLGLPVNPAVTGDFGWHSLPTANSSATKSFTVDLGKSWPLEEVRLVPCFRPGFYSQDHYGFPSRFVIEASEDADFSNKWIVSDQSSASLPNPGQNLQCFPVSQKNARYVRMTSKRMRDRGEDFAFAMAELQAYSDGMNVALGAKVIAEDSLDELGWSRAALTDGLTSTGKLLELTDWVETLEQCRFLSQRRDNTFARRKTLLEKTKQTLVGIGVGGGIVLPFIAAGWVWRSQRRRRILDREKLRERLARDLHDELGSNLGSIALISSFADRADEVQMRLDLAKIEDVARESANSMRDMVFLLAGKREDSNSDWLRVMIQSAKRSMPNVELDLQIPVSPIPRDPNLETRREIYLFCKEVLHNITRHSKADKVSFILRPTTEGLRIEITDNGEGFDAKTIRSGHGLGNLRERATMMKARMTLDSALGKGTAVILDIPASRRWTKRNQSPNP